MLWGYTVTDTMSAEATQILATSPVLDGWVEAAPLQDALVSRHGVPLVRAAPAAPGQPIDREAMLAPHALLVGRSGSGKTSLLETRLAFLLKRGYSVVFLSPKAEDITRALGAAYHAGRAPEQVILVSPREPGGMPAGNLFASGESEKEVAVDVRDLFGSLLGQENLTRLPYLVYNACLVVGAHDNPSLFEVLTFLSTPRYREALMALPARPADPTAYAQACAFFAETFAGWSKAAREEAVSTILYRMGECLHSAPLRALFCADGSRLTWKSLWQRPQCVLLHLDYAGLGQLPGRILLRLLVSGLMRTAQRTRGPVPVALVMDEAGDLAQVAGSDLGRILTQGRALGLELTLATQYLAQFPREFVENLETNVGTLLAFSCGPADASLLSRTLSGEAPTPLKRLSLALAHAGPGGSAQSFTYQRYRVVDGWGQPVRLCPEQWPRLREMYLFGEDQIGEITALAQAAGVGSLFVVCGDGAPRELGALAKRLPAGSCWIEGLSLSLVVALPRVRVSAQEHASQSEAERRWRHHLLTLPRQQAVLFVDRAVQGTLRIVDHPPLPEESALAAYRQAVLRANGQSPAEVAAAMERRERAVAWLGTGERPAVPGPSRIPAPVGDALTEPEELPDGSLF